MAVDAKDLGALEKALNDAAGKASVLWTTFVTFELYLAIAFGSVKHRDLFLENPVKLPILNVDLPLVAFFVVAPALLVIFHFYVFLQLYGLGIKARVYNDLLNDQVKGDSHNERMRQRLDTFLILQFLAGPKEQRKQFQGFSLRAIAWFTLVGAPILILLQAQVVFLAYHDPLTTWAQRLLLLIDLVVIWGFWDRIRSEDNPILGPVQSYVWYRVGVALSIGAFVFSALLATFPGEWVGGLTDIPYWRSLHKLLFAGAADEVTGQPRSLFSNRLVLTDQTFVDGEKLEKVEVSRSLRGRDLRGAVLNRSDLRKADFTGARLDRAELNSAKLDKARFGCPPKREDMARVTQFDIITVVPPEPYDDCTSLEGASLYRARLQGALLDHAQLQGASLNGAQLQGASLNGAQLQGASLHDAQLQGASLIFTQLQAASLYGAQLQGASLYGAQLQGASLDAQLQGASLVAAQLQGASLFGAHLKGASLDEADVWRVKTPVQGFDLTSLQNLNCTKPPWDEKGQPEQVYKGWRDKILSRIPEVIRKHVSLSSLAPDKKELSSDPQLNALLWSETNCPLQQNPDAKHLAEYLKHLAEYLVTLACSPEAAPHVARALISNGRIKATGVEIATIADRLRGGKADAKTCPGVKGFTDGDWEKLDQLVERVQKEAAKAEPSQH